jgi:hypothetical protein
MVRVAAWALVVCAALGALGVLVPSIELRVGRAVISRHTQVSLLGVSRDGDRVRGLLAAFQRARVREVGGQLLRHVAPRVGGRPGSVLADARDAVEALDGVRDDEVRTASLVLAVAVWVLIALETLVAGLVFGALMRGVFARRRFVAALISTLVAAAIAGALHVASQVVAWRANEEVGATVIALRPAAYLLPIAALCGLGLAIALVVRPPPAEPAGRG